MKYKSLKELKKAYDSSELTDPICLDNDDSFVYVGEEKVYQGGTPEELLDEALELLKIPSEGA